METQKVLQALGLIFENGESAANTELCAACLNHYKNMLRPGADPEDSRLIWAAAARANYYLCVKSIRSPSSFKAGDVSLSGESEGKIFLHAAEILSAAEKELLPLLKDGGFFCGGVDVYERGV